MTYNYFIQEDEKIELIINPNKGLLWHTNDFIKIVAFIFFITLVIAAKHIFFIGFGIILIFLFARAIITRYENTVSKYIITDQRILFVRNNTVKKSFFHENLKYSMFENCGNNRGYIILGKPKEVFSGRGINFAEDEYVLENLTNFNEVATLLKKMIKKNCI